MRIDLEVTDCTEDPKDDAAFAVNLELKGPGTRADLMRVSFGEDFMTEYFHIPWYKNLPRTEHSLVHEKRTLFILWALARVQDALLEDINWPRVNLLVDFPTDADWARRVESGNYPIKWVKRSENKYYLEL